MFTNVVKVAVSTNDSVRLDSIGVERRVFILHHRVGFYELTKRQSSGIGLGSWSGTTTGVDKYNG